MVNKRGSRKIDHETDDVFDETPELGIKIKREKQAQYEDGFEDSFIVNLQNNLLRHDGDCSNIGKVTDQESSIATGRCLTDEDPDDVFEEDQEVSKNIYFDNIARGIKIEVDEETDTLYKETNLQENSDYLTTVIKQENNIEHCVRVAADALLENSSDLSIANFATNGEMSVGDGEQRIEVELNIEHEGSRINPKYRRKCSFNTEQRALRSNRLPRKVKNSSKCGKTVHTQMGNENIPANETVITNTNNVAENGLHPIVKGRRKQSNLNSLIKKGKYVTKESLKQKAETNIDIIKSREQNERLENVITKDSIKNNAREKRLNSNKKQQSDVDNKQNGNNESCDLEKDKQIEMEMGSTVNTNSLSQSSPTLITTTATKSKKGNEKEPRKQPLRKSRTNSNKITKGKEKVTQRQLVGKQITPHIDESKIIQGCSDQVINITESKEKSTVIDGNEKQAQIKPPEAHQFVEEIDEGDAKPHNRHVEYECTKCSFKAKRKAVLKRHLLKHGIEFSSTITSFLDIIEKAKLYTSQLEKIYDGQEPQRQIVTRNNCIEAEEVCSGTTLSKNVLGSEMNLRLNDTKKPIDIPDSALQVQSINSYTRTLSKTQTVTQNKDAFVINLMDTVAQRSTYINQNIEVNYVNLDKNWSSESEIDHVKDVEIDKAKSEKNPSINIEYSCAKCLFKTKRRAILKRHLVTHGTGLSSGIISFLDLVKNNGVLANQFGEDGEDKEVQIQHVSEDLVIENKVETLDDPVLNSNYDVESKDRIKLENTDVTLCDIITEIADNEVPDAVGINKKNQVLLPLNDTKITTNVDIKCENINNQINEDLCIETSNGRKMVLRTQKRKRCVSRWSLPKKKKLESNSPKLYCCDECSFQSDKKKYFDSHKLVHSKNTLKCNNCDFITNQQRNLNSHMLVHLKSEKINLHKCSHCPYQSKRKYDLRLHMILHQKPEEMKLFQCDKCPYQSKRKTNLKRHQICHIPTTSSSMFNCAGCSFRTNRRTDLTKHMLLHRRRNELIWYKCPQCPYASIQNSALRKHSLVHKARDEIKTYDCPKCPYKAKHKCHLKTHLLIHMDPEEVEMHQCEYCSYKSLRKDNLRAHMLQHKRNEEISMVKCAQCSFATKLKSNLLKHIQRTHRWY